MKTKAISRIHLTIAAVVAAFLLAIVAAAATLSWQQKQEVISDGFAQASRFVSGAVAGLNRSLLDVDVLLASLQEAENLVNLSADEKVSVTTSQTLHAIVKRNLMLQRLVILDQQSQVVATSDVPDVAPVSLPQEFVKRLLATQVPSLLVSSPMLDRSSYEHVVLLGRKSHLENGKSLITVAEVHLMHLNTIMLQGADIAGLEVTLERSDGQVLSTNPFQDKLLGQYLGALNPRLASSAVRMPARLSGQDALVVAKPILVDDLLIVASIPMDAALAYWRQQRNFIVLVAAIFSVMVLLAGWFGGMYLMRLTEARQDVQKSKTEIEHLAYFDSLTDLPNRHSLMDRLQRALTLTARRKRLGALLFLDLDNFKTINDTLGHGVGDLLLKQVAARLTSCMRESDTVARFGGDEFIVLLEDLSDQLDEAADQARRIGDKILTSLGQVYVLGGQVLNSSASVGAALFGNEPKMPIELLKQADIAMYEAKSQGRSRLCFFDPQMQANISARAALERDLQTALEQQQFVLYFQPQVRHTGQVIGAEVLIRWQHPQRGLVPPVEFIPVAEESNLIHQMGQWVLRTACRQLHAWQRCAATANLQLAVNVSARQFLQTDFVAQIDQVITETGVAPQGLKLELTESLVLDNVDDTIAKMTAVKALGVRFSMDDFGTGQSSLSYLTRLPLAQLKIDQSFVRNIGIQPSDGMIVQTIIGMAKNLALEVIAEGVENAAQRDFLADKGCTLYQGYLYGKPTPLADFEALLQHSLKATP